MWQLHLVKETFTYGYNEIYLNILSLIVVLCGIFVIISKNPIISVLYLIGLFLGISCYLIMLGMNFLGLSYLLVYIGAVSILFLFILMLINVRISELLADTSNSIPLAIIVAICFNNVYYNMLPFSITYFNIDYYNHLGYFNKINEIFSSFNSDNTISFISHNIWDSNLSETSHISSLGNIMYTNYSIWLIITSIILLLAMVGAIVITIKGDKQ